MVGTSEKHFITKIDTNKNEDIITSLVDLLFLLFSFEHDDDRSHRKKLFKTKISTVENEDIFMILNLLLHLSRFEYDDDDRRHRKTVFKTEMNTVENEAIFKSTRFAVPSPLLTLEHSCFSISCSLLVASNPDPSEKTTLSHFS